MSDWVMTGFVGYGRLEADLWLLGMEEHCLDFRRWATTRWSALGGRTPIEACVARDRADLINEAKLYTRLHKRYGGTSAEEIRAAVKTAHARIETWQVSP